MSAALLALSLVSHFDCHTLDGINIYAEVESINQENFTVRVSDDYGERPVHSKRIAFDELGELREVETYAWWERFHIQRVGRIWSGEYWYDNYRAGLTCVQR